MAQSDGIERRTTELNWRRRPLKLALLAQHALDILDADVAAVHDLSHVAQGMRSAKEFGQKAQSNASSRQQSRGSCECFHMVLAHLAETNDCNIAAVALSQLDQMVTLGFRFGNRATLRS